MVIWVVLAGGLSVYMRHRDANPVKRPAGRAVTAARAAYVLELTPAFAAAPDPFALLPDGGKAPALSARLRGKDVVVKTEGVPAGVPIVVDSLPGVIEGDNEIVVAASPPVEETPRRHFLQARVLRNGVPIASETFWADGFARVDGVLRFTAPAEASDAGE